MHDERLRRPVRSLFTAGVAAALVGIATGLGGCESPPENVMPPIFVATPLDLDPTDDTPVDGWWSNDAQLLHLGADGKYELFHDLNRFHGRSSVGRWHRISYAVVHFEPYARRQFEPTRVPIDRKDGTLHLNVPGRAAFHQIDAAPRVLEDELVGAWNGADGRFVLSDDGRYAFDVRGAGAAPVRIAGHVGRWALVDDAIVLTPDLPRMGPFRFPVAMDDDGAPVVTNLDGAPYRADTQRDD